MNKTIPAALAAGMLALVACSASGSETSEPLPQAAATDCGSPTPTESPTPTVTQTPTETPTETQPPTPRKIIGMSAPSGLWAQRLAEVAPCGVEARRIFADLDSTGRNQSNLIEQAVAQGMMPVISYKAPSAATAASGGYDAWMSAVKTYLTSLGVPVVAAYWHEPHGDMTATQFQQGSRRFLDRVQSPTIKVGPILNGWLLDNKVSTFAGYTNEGLLRDWDFVAVDTYQNSAGSPYGGRAIPLLETWMDSVGQPDKPLGVGEYNGFDASSLQRGGEAILSTPEVWFGLVWNSGPGGLGTPLTGARLDAYKATKADPRALHDPDC